MFLSSQALLYRSFKNDPQCIGEAASPVFLVDDPNILYLRQTSTMLPFRKSCSVIKFVQGRLWKKTHHENN